MSRSARAAAFSTPAWRHWAERFDHYAAPGTADRVHADVALVYSLAVRGESGEVRRLGGRALALARQLGDPETFFYATLPTLQGFFGLEGEEARQRLAEEMAALPRQGVSAYILGRVLYFRGGSLLSWGQRDRADLLWRELGEVADRTSDAYLQLRPFFIAVILATLGGRLEEALDAASRLQTRAEEMGSPGFARTWLPSLTFRALVYLGRGEEAAAVLEQGTTPLTLPLRILCTAYLGSRAEAQAALSQYLREQGTALREGTTMEVSARLLEAAVLVEDREAAALLESWVALLAGSLGGSERAITCVARHLGAAAALLGQQGASQGLLPAGAGGVRQGALPAGDRPHPPRARGAAARALSGGAHGGPRAPGLRHRGVPGDEDAAGPGAGTGT